MSTGRSSAKPAGLTQALELYRGYQARIAECDREIETLLERFEDRSDGEPPAPNGKKCK